jgi:hypothetical protein
VLNSIRLGTPLEKERILFELEAWKPGIGASDSVSLMLKISSLVDLQEYPTPYGIIELENAREASEWLLESREVWVKSLL